MRNKIATIESPIAVSDYDALSRMTDDALLAELQRGLEDAAKNMMRLATVVRLLEERGRDLSDLKMGLIGSLRRIAYGQLLPEVVVRYAEYPMLMRRVEMLPIPDQRRLASGEPIRLAVPRDGGGMDHRLVDPLKLTRDQISLVFARDHIRDEVEQINVLQTRKMTTTAKPDRDHRRVRPDREKGGIHVGRAFATQAEVVEALAGLLGDEDDGLREKTVAAKLSEAEYEKLWKAAGPNRTMNDIIRAALRAAGLI